VLRAKCAESNTAVQIAICGPKSGGFAAFTQDLRL
jgi:hypothetical protein